MNRKCVCCGKELEYIFGSQRFCNACSVTNTDTRKLADYYKGKYERLRRVYVKTKNLLKEYELKTKKDVKTYYKKEEK